MTVKELYDRLEYFVRDPNCIDRPVDVFLYTNDNCKPKISEVTNVSLGRDNHGYRTFLFAKDPEI